MSIRIFNKLPDCIAKLVENKKSFISTSRQYLVSRSFYSLEEFLNDLYSHRRSGWPSQDKDMNIICYNIFCILDMVRSRSHYAFLVLFACFMSGLFIDC